MPADRTPVQIEASRTNDARSLGPVTEAGEDRKAFAALHTAVSSDWGPRDAYERRWVMELVNAMWRQDRLRGLELATLTAAAAESPPTEATMQRLLTFARYGARIDKDIGRALQALRVLRDRPDACIEELRNDTPEPDAPAPQATIRTNETPPRTPEPTPPPPAPRTPEPGPRLNRHQRRALAAMRRRQAA